MPSRNGYTSIQDTCRIILLFLLIFVLVPCADVFLLSTKSSLGNMFKLTNHRGIPALLRVTSSPDRFLLAQGMTQIPPFYISPFSHSFDVVFLFALFTKWFGSLLAAPFFYISSVLVSPLHYNFTFNSLVIWSVAKCQFLQDTVGYLPVHAFSIQVQYMSRPICKP